MVKHSHSYSLLGELEKQVQLIKQGLKGKFIQEFGICSGMDYVIVAHPKNK